MGLFVQLGLVLRMLVQLGRCLFRGRLCRRLLGVAIASGWSDVHPPSVCERGGLARAGCGTGGVATEG